MAKGGELAFGEVEAAEEEVLEWLIWLSGKLGETRERDVRLGQFERFEVGHLKEDGDGGVVDAFGFPEFEVA